MKHVKKHGWYIAGVGVVIYFAAPTPAQPARNDVEICAGGYGREVPDCYIDDVPAIPAKGWGFNL